MRKPETVTSPAEKSWLRGEVVILAISAYAGIAEHWALFPIILIGLSLIWTIGSMGDP